MWIEKPYQEFPSSKNPKMSFKKPAHIYMEFADAKAIIDGEAPSDIIAKATQISVKRDDDGAVIDLYSAVIALKETIDHDPTDDQPFEFDLA